MASHSVLNLVTFRTNFAGFSNQSTYPDAMILAYYGQAGSYIDQNDNLDGLNGTTLDWALQLLTCHLLTIAYNISIGQPLTQPIQLAQEGSVQVQFSPPVAKSAFSWWLAATPYGQQLQGLLTVQSVGGWSVGGIPETSAFRKVGGMF